MVEIFTALENAASDMGLTIIEEKTNFMLVSTREQDVQSLRIGNYTFKEITQLNNWVQLLPIKMIEK